MSEFTLELLGRLVDRVLEGQRRIEDRLDRVEATMATKVQLGSVLQVLELKLDLLGTERRDDHAALARRLDVLENRVKALEEHEPV
jgi:hypothetical protein